MLANPPLSPGGPARAFATGAGASSHRRWFKNVAGFSHGRSGGLSAIYRSTPAMIASASRQTLKNDLMATGLPILFGQISQNRSNAFAASFASTARARLARVSPERSEGDISVSILFFSGALHCVTSRFMCVSCAFSVDCSRFFFSLHAATRPVELSSRFGWRFSHPVNWPSIIVFPSIAIRIAAT